MRLAVADRNGTPVVGVAAYRARRERPWWRRRWMSIEPARDGVIRFSTIGKVAISVIIGAHIGLMGWALAQSAANGAALMSMRNELAVRVAKANDEHASYMTRAELAAIIQRLDQRIGDLADALRDERRPR